MYMLVNDIESYPNFLPWCTNSTITNYSDNELVASVSISIGKIKKIFVTKNTMQQDSSISMELIEGPFKKLNGQWKFKNNLDPRKYNGAIFLGLKGPVVKSHGSTDAFGFYHSIDLCYRIIKGNLMNQIKENLSHIDGKR